MTTKPKQFLCIFQIVCKSRCQKFKTNMSGKILSGFMCISFQIVKKTSQKIKTKHVWRDVGNGFYAFFQIVGKNQGPKIIKQPVWKDARRVSLHFLSNLEKLLLHIAQTTWKLIFKPPSAPRVAYWVLELVTAQQRIVKKNLAKSKKTAFLQRGWQDFYVSLFKTGEKQAKKLSSMLSLSNCKENLCKKIRKLSFLKRCWWISMPFLFLSVSCTTGCFF